MKYWLFVCITSCVSAEGKGPREGADLGFGLSSSHHGLLLRDAWTGSQAPLSTHLLPTFYHQGFALAGNPMQLHHTAPEPAQFKARFSVRPFPDSQLSLLPLLSPKQGGHGPHLSIHCVPGCTPSAWHTTGITVVTAVIILARIRLCG